MAAPVTVAAAQVEQLVTGKVYPVTMHGFHEWTEAMFEKLGWMVLAKSRGMEHSEKKIAVYKEGVKELLKALNARLTLPSLEADRRYDLEILKTNVEVLDRFLDKNDLSVPAVGGKKNKDNRNKDKR
jgi:hypothetical protein